MTHWLLGYPDKALERSQEALALACELTHPVQHGSRAVLLRLGPSTTWREQAVNECIEAAVTLALAEIYGWFTEGFDTADLRQARTLLEELS
jgi:hypothetical protein